NGAPLTYLLITQGLKTRLGGLLNLEKPRLRHPRGVTTLDIDPETQTIEDLKVLVFSATEIPPNEQEIKYGYPPKTLPNTSDTLATIPITRGEQIIVVSVPAPSKPPFSTASTPAPSLKAINETLSAPSPLAEADIPIESSDSIALPGRDAGFIQLRIVPDDNSCLFSAIGVVFEGGVEGGEGLRNVVADAIRDDPEAYSDVILGKPRNEYVKTILKSDTWGGAIGSSTSQFTSRVKPSPNRAFGIRKAL
ncbi:MAG: ubiquitin-specific protease otu1, partial [Tremellales sp. Tagirdzhanova-0007]